MSLVYSVALWPYAEKFLCTLRQMRHYFSRMFGIIKLANKIALCAFGFRERFLPENLVSHFLQPLLVIISLIHHTLNQEPRFTKFRTKNCTLLLFYAPFYLPVLVLELFSSTDSFAALSQTAKAASSISFRESVR